MVVDTPPVSSPKPNNANTNQEAHPTSNIEKQRERVEESYGAIKDIELKIAAFKPLTRDEKQK